MAVGWLKAALSSWLGSIAAWAGVAAVAIGFYFAIQQVQQSRESRQATIIYGFEKDFHDLFAKTESFGGQTQLMPQLCTQPEARETLQTLVLLQDLDAVSAPFV